MNYSGIIYNIYSFYISIYWWSERVKNVDSFKKSVCFDNYTGKSTTIKLILHRYIANKVLTSYKEKKH